MTPEDRHEVALLPLQTLVDGARVSRPMRIILTRFRDLLTSEDGPTAVEYAVMLALILVACITVITTFGTNLSTTFSTIGSTVPNNGS